MAAISDTAIHSTVDSAPIALTAMVKTEFRYLRIAVQLDSRKLVYFYAVSLLHLITITAHVEI
jgi:hypothetical protein